MEKKKKMMIISSHFVSYVIYNYKSLFVKKFKTF